MLYTYKNNKYPLYLKKGNAVQYIQPIAEKVCIGRGLDIGGTSEHHLKDSTPVNILFNNGLHAENLPSYRGEAWDYIFSSHTLEHLENPIRALRYWKDYIRKDGVLFLYLPHPDMEYWLTQNNPKHLHSWYPKDMEKILTDIGFTDVFVSERDSFYSFSAFGFNTNG
jgi:SAM-dependent methyltransferase